MKELDVLLVDYLERRYPGAAAAEQSAFRDLLEQQDPVLYAYVTGRERPASEEERRVIDTLRRAS
ncbi:MAG TPA: succinate dehydrogenase assembly factor 2 [Gammaproteobacteria bacterium]|nr:succinate dehydrogenase assembly factor 2 [Gammaproteobacteria bacterium]